MNCVLLMHFGLSLGLCSLQYLSGKLSHASLNALLTKHWLVSLQNPIDFLSQSCLMLTSTQSAAYEICARIIKNRTRFFTDIGILSGQLCGNRRCFCRFFRPSTGLLGSILFPARF